MRAGMRRGFGIRTLTRRFAASTPDSSLPVLKHPHPALRATLSRRERDPHQPFPSLKRSKLQSYGLRPWLYSFAADVARIECRGPATIYFLVFSLPIFGFLVMATDYGRS